MYNVLVSNQSRTKTDNIFLLDGSYFPESFRPVRNTAFNSFDDCVQFVRSSGLVENKTPLICDIVSPTINGLYVVINKLGCDIRD